MIAAMYARKSVRLVWWRDEERLSLNAQTQTESAASQKARKPRATNEHQRLELRSFRSAFPRIRLPSSA